MQRIGGAERNEPRYHERVFRRFERLPWEEAFEGTGIGLAIVKEGMQRLKGEAGVESEPGKGSRFWIRFPLEEKSHELAA